MEIGLVLSGGAIRGIAHAGVMKALEENDIKITAIGGSSSGSLVSALYAIGYSPDNILTLFKRYAKNFLIIDRHIIWKEVRTYLTKRKIEDNGLKSGEEFEELYNKLAFLKNIKKITDVKMPIITTTTDILDGKSYICSSIEVDDKSFITDISLGEAVRASSSFPILFKPFQFKNHLFLDGGILNNIPAEALKKIGAKKVLVIKFDESEVKENSPAIDIATRILDLMCNKIAEKNLDYSDYTITIPTDKIGLLDINQIDYSFNLGYEIAKKEMDKIKEKLV